MIKKQLLKKNLPDKIDAAKNALLFLSRAPAHSFIFNSRFLYELKDMVGLSKTKLYLGFRIFDSVSFLLKISYSIKSPAVQKKQKRKKKKKTNIKATTRFMKRKMLIFTKFPFKRFIWNVIDIFCFPYKATNII